MWPEIPADLTSLTDEELSALEDELVAYFNEVSPTIADAEGVRRLGELATGIEGVRGESASRAEAAEAIAVEVAEMASRINPAAADEPDEPAEVDPAPDDAQVDPAGNPIPEVAPGGGPANPTPAPDPGTGQAPEPSAEERRAAANANRMALSTMANRSPARTQPRPASPLGRVTITASADVPGYAPGQRITDVAGIARALIERHHNLGTGRGAPEDRVPVVRFTLDTPADRNLSSQMSPRQVQEAISRFAVSGQALTAAGGLCAPTEGYYDQLVIAETARPVRDFLPNFGADRGGIRFNPPPKLSQITQGVGVVTAAQDSAGVTFADGSSTSGSVTYTSATAAFTQADVGRTIVGTNIPLGATIAGVTNATTISLSVPATATGSSLSFTVGRGSKATFTVTCPAIVETLVQAIYTSIQFGNFLGRSFPEQVEAWVSLAAALAARVAETALLDGIAANSTAVTSAGLVGAAREVLARMGQAAMGYRSRNRMSPDATLDVLLPSWVPDLIAADIARTFTADETLISEARSRASAWLAARNVRVGWYLDSKTGGNQIIAAQSVGVLNQYPATCLGYIYAPGTFLHLDAGTLDLGLVRDSTLNANNNFRMFSEVFENIAFVGVESLEVSMALCADGSYGAAKAVTCPIVT